jgi:hypothetical protein
MQMSADQASSDPGSLGRETIARRPYQLWEREGWPEGRDVDHWLRAERNLSGDGPENPGGDAVTLADEDSAGSPSVSPAHA